MGPAENIRRNLPSRLLLGCPTFRKSSLDNILQPTAPFVGPLIPWGIRILSLGRQILLSA
jgi:hypothetical protein